MADQYYDPKYLRKFGKITEWSEELGTKFFDYYGKVFEEGALTAREKSLIALAVAHTEQCPYCIDAYTKDGLQKGITKEEMMEAVHVGAAIQVVDEAEARETFDLLKKMGELDELTPGSAEQGLP